MAKKKATKKKGVVRRSSQVVAKSRRIKLIERIEKLRKSRIISYITSTRDNLESKMAMDAVRIIANHLPSMKGSNIDLFIVSNGGDGIVPWKLVTLIREYTNKFSVLVPYRAFSAATLTALGADEILMHPMGMLGPTDPTVANPFNPQDPDNPANRLGISVEDVTAYLALIKEDAGIQHEDQVVQAFALLAEKVHPLALGNVKRSLSQSRMMARKLLSLHMDKINNEHRIGEIVDNLTSKLFYHGHPINRKEAIEDVGLINVKKPGASIERAMWRLFTEYESAMKSDVPFDAAMEFVATFPDQPPGNTSITEKQKAYLAFIESTVRTDVASIEYRLTGTKDPKGITAVNQIFSQRGWSSE